MVRSRSLLAALLAGLFQLSLVGASVAQPSPPDARARARLLADEAANSYAQGEYRDAHELLTRAYARVAAPTIAVLDARALGRLGRLVEARAAYRRALEAPLTDDAPAAYRQAVQQAQDELALLERRTPRLSIAFRGASATDPAVRLVVDGVATPVGASGTLVPLDPGAHWLRADLGHEQGAVHHLSLREGETKRVVLEVRSSRSRASQTWTIAGFSVGGAGILAGIVTGSVAMSARSDAARDCPDQRCIAGDRGESALDRFRTYRAVSTASYAVGLVGIGLGTAFVLSGSERRNVRVALAPGANGIRLEGTL